MQVQRRTSLTCGNPVIEKRLLEKQNRKLANIIRNIKPAIDTSPPPVRHINSVQQNANKIKGGLLRSQSEDQKMVATILRTMNRPYILPTVVDASSLNIDRRREELRSITQSNWKLLGRLESAQSQYSCKSMENEYMKNQRYVFNLSFSTRKKYEELIRRQHKAVREPDHIHNSIDEKSV